MALKIDINRTVRDVTGPFEALQAKIEEKHKKKLVNQWIREELEPRVRKWEEADPVLFAQVASSRSHMRGQTMYLYLNGDSYALPSNKAWPSSLPCDMVQISHLVAESKDEDLKREMGQAATLAEKAASLKELLSAFLEGFTSAEQAIFSLPELKSFVPVKCASQKRPRFFKVPSNDLRRLMMEAARLKEALNAQTD